MITAVVCASPDVYIGHGMTARSVLVAVRAISTGSSPTCIHAELLMYRTHDVPDKIQTW